MPEEINRILTDSISDYLFVTEKSGLENLKSGGVSHKKIFFVGNTMIDTQKKYLNHFETYSQQKIFFYRIDFDNLQNTIGLHYLLPEIYNQLCILLNPLDFQILPQKH